MSHTLTQADLDHFNGSEQFYRHGMVRHIIYTEGAAYLAEAGGAYWLLDEIALAQAFNRKVKAEPFQVWTLTRNASGSGAVLRCEDGNNGHIYTKRIPFTDFPLREPSRCGSKTIPFISQANDEEYETYGAVNSRLSPDLYAAQVRYAHLYLGTHRGRGTVCRPLGDPYPGVHWPQAELETAVLQAIIANYLPLVCEER